MCIMNCEIAEIIEAVVKKLQNEKRIIIAIDGRCASGKTTLADILAKHLGASVIHIDDFFLRPEQRTEERYAKAGENIDHERFLAEVLMPLSKGESVCYRPFDCKTGGFGEEIRVADTKVTLIEGAYCLHPSLKKYYNLKIFVDAEYETRIERIRVRNGEVAVEQFEKRWIPLEEKYFNTFKVQDECDFCLNSFKT